MASARLTPTARRGWLTVTAQALATGFGSGYSPIAPGTAGSAVGLLLFVPLSLLSPLWQLTGSHSQPS